MIPEGPAPDCPRTAAAGPPKRHSTYSALVLSDADMAGHVAYALYKRDKLKFCEFSAAKHGRPVSADELATFIDTANLPTRLDAYRTEAEQLLGNFADEVLELQREQDRTAMDRKLIQELKAARSFPRAVGENLAGSLLTVAIVALLALVLYGTRIGFFPLLADVFGYEVTPKQVATPPDR